MFVAILDWMLANTPGFLRPGVSWLLSGLRKITGYISSLWNSVGNAAGNLYVTISAMRAHLVTFAVTVMFALLWLELVWIPAKVGEGVNLVQRITIAIIMSVRAELAQGLQAVQAWAQYGLGRLNALVAAVIDWATRQLARVDAFLAALLDALAHVINGPDVLAEWLIGATWRAALRYLFSQRDRIVNWLFRGSFAFTAWIAKVLEDTLVRML